MTDNSQQSIVPTSKENNDSMELYYAEMESARNTTLEAWFIARPHVTRGAYEESIFRAGFERAFSLLWNARRQDETSARCAKPDIHHPACNCLERESRDAERYRFIRQPGNAIVYAKDRSAWGNGASGHVRYDTAEQLDAAVDAARAPVKASAELPSQGAVIHDNEDDYK